MLAKASLGATHYKTTGSELLVIDQFQKLAFDRRQHPGQIMTALQDLSLFSVQRPHALTIAFGRTFLNPDLGAL